MISIQIKRLINRLICVHEWADNLVFCPAPNTHADKRHCGKCGKSETLFRGTRDEWRAEHNIK